MNVESQKNKTNDLSPHIDNISKAKVKDRYFRHEDFLDQKQEHIFLLFL